MHELLVLRCRRGDRQALDEMSRLWQDRLFYYIRRLVRSEEDAWDVLQQTWIRVFRGVRSLEDPARFSVWLYRVARTAVLGHWRSRYREPFRLEPECRLDDLVSEAEGTSFEDCEQVHHGLGLISLAHREVLTLHFLEDFSVEQIAEVLGIPEGTVKSRLFHARRSLREVLEREEGRS